jgi:hypothetical protein
MGPAKDRRILGGTSRASMGVMRTRSLEALLVSAVAAGAAAVACTGGENGSSGSSGSSGSIGTSGLTYPFDCSASPAFAELRRAIGADYLAARSTSDTPPDAGTDAGAEDSAFGTPCATASNAEACKAAFASLNASDSEALFGQCGGCRPGGVYLVFTKGDEVGKVTNQRELRALVGAVETEAEAWIIALTNDYSMDCSKPWIKTDARGFLVRATKTIGDCPVQTKDVLLLVKADGTIEIDQEVVNPAGGGCVGRRPAGLVADRGAPGGGSTVGRHLAKIARLEAASVDAFSILRDELDAHGAPRALLRACERAAADEARHARIMGRLARRYGAMPRRARVVRRPVRSLFDIALENAIEGCVRETYGAAEGMWQAEAAEDLAIRKAMRGIARDETRHGALSWSIAEWLDTRLSAGDRRRVRDARDREARKLLARVTASPARELVRVAGVPSATNARAIATELSRTLWNA